MTESPLGQGLRSTRVRFVSSVPMTGRQGRLTVAVATSQSQVTSGESLAGRRLCWEPQAMRTGWNRPKCRPDRDRRAGRRRWGLAGHPSPRPGGGSWVVDQTHWDHLPDGHTRAIALEQARTASASMPTLPGGQLDVVITAGPTAHRHHHCGVTAQTLSSPGGTTTGTSSLSITGRADRGFRTGT